MFPFLDFGLDSVGYDSLARFFWNGIHCLVHLRTSHQHGHQFWRCNQCWRCQRLRQLNQTSLFRKLKFCRFFFECWFLVMLELFGKIQKFSPTSRYRWSMIHLLLSGTVIWIPNNLQREQHGLHERHGLHELLGLHEQHGVHE